MGKGLQQDQYQDEKHLEGKGFQVLVETSHRTISFSPSSHTLSLSSESGTLATVGFRVPELRQSLVQHLQPLDQEGQVGLR